VPDLNRIVHPIDRFQQRHRWLAFPFGVIKKFGDNQGGNLAALITYYGFLSLFPLLLVMTTVLGFILEDNPKLQKDVVDSALAQFPVVGDQLARNIHSIQGNGVALVIGVLVALYGGLGVANAAQNAMNRIWEVPMHVRPGFFPRLLRSLEVIAILAANVFISTGVSWVAGRLGHIGDVERALLVVVSIAVNLGLFLLAFRVLTAAEIAWRDHLPGAVVAAIAFEILHFVGTWFVDRQLRGMSALYGAFALVLGLLAWIYLQAQVVLYAAEINAVKKQRLWPRSLAPPPFTEADERAYKKYTEVEQRAPQATKTAPQATKT
jgi:YihY family inner membrane protein